MSTRIPVPLQVVRDKGDHGGARPAGILLAGVAAPGRVSSAFDCVACGIDGSDEAPEAARQASRLAREMLVLLAAVDSWDLVLAGPATGDATEGGRSSATEDEPVHQALARMLHHKIDHMPPVRAGVPVGMLARFDLVRLASQTWDARQRGSASNLERARSGRPDSSQTLLPRT